MKRKFEENLEISKHNPESIPLMITDTTTRQSTCLIYWLFIGGSLFSTYMSPDSFAIDENGVIDGILRCSNRNNGCRFRCRCRFIKPSSEYDDESRKIGQNWKVQLIPGAPEHKEIHPTGRTTLAKSSKALKCCNYSVPTALKKIFNSLNNKMVGKKSDPLEEAKQTLIGNEYWTNSEIASVINSRNAKRSRRKIEKP